MRGWVQHVEGFYDKPTFDGAAININDLQTFNNGDLKVATALDTWPSIEEPPIVDPDDEGSAGGKIVGGCAVDQSEATPLWSLLGFVALALLRRRSAPAEPARPSRRT